MVAELMPRAARRLRRPAWPLLIAVILALGILGLARAHISVEPSTVTPATNLVFAVRVPNERDEPTVQVRIEVPPELVVSRFQPKPGWQRAVERDGGGRVSAVTWSGGSIGIDEYEDFSFAARTPAEPAVLAIKAYQTYQSGETVEWTGDEAADTPAALVTVATDAAGANGAAGLAPIEGGAPLPSSAPPSSAETTRASAAGAAPSVVVAEWAQPRPTAADGGTDMSLVVAIVALVVALAALVLAGVAVLRRAAGQKS